MNLLLDAIRSHAASFDDLQYPTDVYYHLLTLVREANSPKQLGGALAHLIAWNNGKVRRDSTGAHTAYPNRRFSVGRTKPSTLSAQHEAVLTSKEFYAWACTVRSSGHFDAALIETLQEDFKLWKGVVLPVFVLHCLRPPIYPIVDVYAMLVFNLLRPSYGSRRFRKSGITVDDYVDYHKWWLQLMKEAEIPQLSAELNELKEIDSGISALGRAMFKQAKELTLSEDDLESTEHHPQALPDLASRRNAVAKDRPGTDSKEFKMRAIVLWKGGRTQADALQVAAKEMGITLKKSYSRYPGSHFDRWRKQGFWKRDS